MEFGQVNGRGLLVAGGDALLTMLGGGCHRILTVSGLVTARWPDSMKVLNPFPHEEG